MLAVRTKLTFLCIAAAIAATPSPSAAAGVGGYARGFGSSFRRVIEGSNTLAPFASVVFCVHNKDQCADTGGEEVVVLTEDRRAEMLSVNSGINRAIRPQNDPPGKDVWSVDVSSGDCEDYALTKRKHLMQLGWSPRALRIAVATTRSGEGHAVLIVRTSDGDLVLDNRTSVIRDWTRTDLHWMKMQTTNAYLWVEMREPQERVVNVSERW